MHPDQTILEKVERLIESTGSKHELPKEEKIQLLKDLVAFIKNERLLVSLGLSRQTLSNWNRSNEEKGTFPTRANLISIKNQIVDLASKKSPLSTNFGSQERSTTAKRQKVALYTPQQIHDRVNVCKILWIIKTIRGFSIAYGGETTSKYFEFLKNNPELQINLLYTPNSVIKKALASTDAKARTDYLAKAEDTYKRLKKAIGNNGDDVARRISGYKLTMGQAFCLGVGIKHQSTIIMEYDPNKIDRGHRIIDVFSEISVAPYERSISQPLEKNEIFWGLSPLSEATELWSLWEPILRSITKK